MRFCQWATKQLKLKQILAHGCAVDRQRFEANARELEAALDLMRRTAHSEQLPADGGRALIDLVGRYTRTFLRRQRSDEGPLSELHAPLSEACCTVFGRPASLSPR